MRRTLFSITLFATLVTSATIETTAQILWASTNQNGAVFDVAISPDGSLLASANEDKQIALAKLEDGAPVRTLTGHTERVLSVAFSPDGETLASTSVDRTLRLWRIADGTEIRRITRIQPHHGTYTPLAFSPDGSMIASSMEGTNSLAIWSVTDGTLLKTFNSNRSGVHTVEFSPNGRLIAAAGGIRGADTTVKIWNVDNASLAATLVTENDYGINSLTFSPDGSTLAIGTHRYLHFKGGIEIWRTSDWSRLQTIPVRGESLLFDPSGKILAFTRIQESSGPISSLELRRTLDGSLIDSFVSPAELPGEVAAAAYSPDGSRIAFGSRLYAPTREGTVFFGVTGTLKVSPIITGINAADGVIPIQWIGAGPVQLQTSNDTPTHWANAGEPTSERLISVPMTGKVMFFRILPVNQN